MVILQTFAGRSMAAARWAGLLGAGVLVACTHASPPLATGRTEPSAQAAPTDGQELVGKAPGEWEATHWLNSPPLSLASLRGKVVLARWWTADCPFCEASAPALRQFDREYRPRGLMVIGFYHHK